MSDLTPIIVGPVKAADGSTWYQIALPGQAGNQMALIRGVMGANGAVINPATDETAQAMLAAIQTLVGEDAGLATAANQSASKTVLDNILAKLGAAVLAAGNAIIGKVGIDQTTPGTNNAVVVGTIDSTGGMCFPDRFDQHLTYNGDGTVATINFTDATSTWTQTYTYTNGKATTISRWVKS